MFLFFFADKVQKPSIDDCIEKQHVKDSLSDLEASQDDDWLNNAYVRSGSDSQAEDSMVGTLKNNRIVRRDGLI